MSVAHQITMMVVSHPPGEMCGTCRFTLLMDDGKRCCRRFPPSVQPPDSNSGLTFTKEDWWCGEYKKQS